MLGSLVKVNIVCTLGTLWPLICLNVPPHIGEFKLALRLNRGLVAIEPLDNIHNLRLTELNAHVSPFLILFHQLVVEDFGFLVNKFVKIALILNQGLEIIFKHSLIETLLDKFFDVAPVKNYVLQVFIILCPVLTKFHVYHMNFFLIACRAHICCVFDIIIFNFIYV